MYRALLLSLAACGRVGFDGATDATIGNGDGPAADGSALTPLHRYRFENNLLDDFGGPPLVPLVAGGFTGNGYQFVANGGLTLPVSSGFPAGAYTVRMVFVFDTVTNWRKILDFDGGALDRGLYVYESALQQVIVPNGGATPDFETSRAVFSPGVVTGVTITRDPAEHVTGYINELTVRAARASTDTVPVNPSGSFEFDDPAGTAKLNAALARWFVDDSGTSAEASSGTVREISLWDRALTAGEVAQL